VAYFLEEHVSTFGVKDLDMQETSMEQEASRASQNFAHYLLHAGCLPGLFFEPEDGGDMFLRNVGWLSMI
jgi:hypothetical protein